MRYILAVIAALAANSAAWADDGRWTLIQSIGEVTVEEPGVSKIAVKPNARLNEGATVTTGANGRAILTDGRSSITVSSNSRLELPAANDENVTAIRQDFGTAVFKVQKKPTAHFEVQTPYLAAVVKGTTFEVSVDALGATVDVEEGLVDVGANLSGERTLVPGGKRVRVLRSGRFDGGRPAEVDRDRQTFTAKNVIEIEIAPEEDSIGGQEREFAALQPQTDRRTNIEDRTFNMERDRDEGASAPSAEAGGPTDGGGSSPLPPEPVRPPPVSVDSGNLGNGFTPPPSRGDDDNDDDDRDRFDRTRWAAFLAKLKQGYQEWSQRQNDYGRDDRGRNNRDDD